MFTRKHQRLFQAWEELRSKWRANGNPFADQLELELDGSGSENYRVVIAGPSARVPLTGFEDLGGPITAARLLRVAVTALVINEAGDR